MTGNHQRKSLATNIVATLVVKGPLTHSSNHSPTNQYWEETLRMYPLQKWFQMKSNINKHVKAHEKQATERMFTCGTCGETYHRRASFNSHVYTMHSTAANGKRPISKNTDAPAVKKSKKMDQGRVSKASEPSATPLSPPQASATAASSSWEVDPVLIPSNLVSSGEENIAQIYQQHLPQICTHFS